MARNRSGIRYCKNCNSRPVYVENGRAHDFCGKRCATSFHMVSDELHDQFERLALSPAANKSQVPCKFPKCRSPAFVGADGTSSGYCSNKHRLEAVKTGRAEACLFCYKWPKATIEGTLSDFCSKKCGQDAILNAPVILSVPMSQISFKDVKKQFLDGWKHPTAKPTVVKVYKIYSDQNHNNNFMRYRQSVERRTGLPGGNSKRRWHGTVRECRLGDSDNDLMLCSIGGCSLCSIIRSSFSLAQAYKRTNFGRFGHGIYTSATSSKSNDYVAEHGGSPYRAVLLSDVVLGKTIKLTTGNTSLREPPRGYDSVVGEPGGDLNYDESIVYKNEAIRPLFLVIYRS
ncbi:ADP-ribosylation [Laetiporus sulphureus 93-53]|uniref:ADP-ribosylation n=1 Tax=Laetiporus sulphureus 93-53 TaxID=1314785 RepID=A0A165BH04_9APHY|nr:ADP-ribosylation [Laetiporus sulphureus 93-53]KZT01037.1 ADP-ribosylation [Laetiporus sulphureus 93-53]